jgi:hypothetical protein
MLGLYPVIERDKTYPIFRIYPKPPGAGVMFA